MEIDLAIKWHHIFIIAGVNVLQYSSCFDQGIAYTTVTNSRRDGNKYRTQA